MSLTDEQKLKIINKDLLVGDLSDVQLGDFCEYANTQYRVGEPIISDDDYDFVYLKALRKRVPNHNIFKSIEPEVIPFSEEKILIPEAMLSIDKAYSFDEILKWIERIFKSIDELNYDPKKLVLKATPKLDGFAGYDDVISYTHEEMEKKVAISQGYSREVLRFLMTLKEVKVPVKL